VLRHLPNIVTASRGALGPIIAWLLLAHGAHRTAFAAFILAMLTDLLDGWLARRLHAESSAGLWLDPVSDKVLTNSTWIALWQMGWVPGWVTALMVGRDLVVATGWLIARRRGVRWRASALGQVAVTFEGIALPVFLFRVPWLDVHWPTVGMLLTGITLALSLASLIEYAVFGPNKRDHTAGAMTSEPCDASPPSRQT